MACLKTTYRMPLDMILDILVWLPAKSALRFKSVCREWCNLINSPFFAKLHLNKSHQPDSGHNQALIGTLLSIPTLRIVDDLYRPSRWTKLSLPNNIDKAYIQVVGSCNGLVCFKFTDIYGCPDIRCFLICNPTTRTFKSILPSSEKKWMERSLSCGFGYDSEHDDYKIVVTSNVWTEYDDRDVRIYRVKADLWSYPTPTTGVSSGKIWENRDPVIFKDKMLYYLVSSGWDYKIARFDVVSEKWTDDLCIPIQLKKYSPKLGAFDGCLYLRTGDCSTEIWILEEDDGSWKKLFRLPISFNWKHFITRSKDRRNRLLFQYYFCENDLLEWCDQRVNGPILLDVGPLPRHTSITPYKDSWLFLNKGARN
ncbi:F-box/kelch-repeat protein At3g23880-like [Silene latifolia]|uniref:F-box/kelch-repeat protein At3g23880-like n=1 Tax=Silene latifolia TaxID=37657 RepID=UPI003D77926F